MTTHYGEEMGLGIDCPNCGGHLSAVVDTRPHENCIVRKRRCRGCGKDYASYELNVDRIESLEINGVPIMPRHHYINAALGPKRKSNGKAR